MDAMFTLGCTIIVVLVIDFICYVLAKFPERIKWYYKVPLGGIAALIKFGRDENEVKKE